MKKFLLLLPVFLFMALIACNDADKKPEETIDPMKAQADSLQKEVVDGHDIAMPKSMRIPALQKETRRLIDSIGKLPAKVRKEADPYKVKLENLLSDLDNAHSSMAKWMDEFKLDSAANNLQQRINYLIEEKLKVDKVKEAVLGSLAKADSLLKSKF